MHKNKVFVDKSRIPYYNDEHIEFRNVYYAGPVVGMQVQHKLVKKSIFCAIIYRIVRMQIKKECYERKQ